MEFIKIRASWNDYPESLYRVMLVDKDITLERLAFALKILFKTQFEHLSQFKVGRTFYVPSDEMDDYDFENKVYDWEKVTLLNALEEKKFLTFAYDLGEGYEFLIKKISQKTYELPIKASVLLLEAKGDGIFEDNISCLEDYLEGKIDEDSLNSYDEDFQNDYDFDVKFDIDYINRMLIQGIKYFVSWEYDEENNEYLDSSYAL